MKLVKIGTRKSLLALIQTELVANYITDTCADYETELVKLVTTGDKVLTKKLDKIGGKGLFVKELDQALMDGRTDLSVHSAKDLPMEIPAELPIVGYSKREDPRDVLVLPEGKTEYDFSGPIGSSSSRRVLQLEELYPGAEIKNVRGNVITRLEKLDNGEYGALVLAAAGLKRLGLEQRISRYFEVDEMLPAAGQGILCVQGRAGESYEYLDGFVDADAEACITAERAFVKTLNGSCSFPIGAYAQIEQEKMTLRGLYYNESNGKYAKSVITGEASLAYELGVTLAGQLKEACE